MKLATVAQRRTFGRHLYQSGFTIVELLVTIGIISTLSTTIIGVTSQARGKAREAVIDASLVQIHRQAVAYWSENDTYGTFAKAACPTSTGTGNAIVNNQEIIDLYASANEKGSGTSACEANIARDSFAVAIEFADGQTWHCIDHSGIITEGTDWSGDSGFSTFDEVIDQGVCEAP